MSNVNMNIPSFAQLLTEGGDTRISLTGNGYNKYGCGVIPDQIALAFGSATASTISQAAYLETEIAYHKLLAAGQRLGAYRAYEEAMDGVRHELKNLCGLNLPAAADVADTDIIFAASGTDLHLIAAQLMASQTNTAVSAAALQVIMVEPGETGSSVPDALSGRHFSQCSALGDRVDAGQAIAGASAINLSVVAIRNGDGTARQLSAVDGDIAALVKQAIDQQKTVMLVLTDVSKTGMLGPSIELAIQLRQQYPHQFSVLVDACQFRISIDSLHGYLRLGFMVAVTGSKFIGGPSFSGALFMPPCLRQQLRKQTLSPALLAYSSRADWPADWTGADHLKSQANLGLLLRWLAALVELRAFRSVPEEAVVGFLSQFGQAIQRYFQQQPYLSMLPVLLPDRRSLHALASWDRFPGIFPFLLKDAAGHFLGREQTMQVYRQLQKNRHIQLGQPVLCGVYQDTPVSALRLCLSARLIVAATSGKGECASKIIAEAVQALDACVELSSRINSRFVSNK